MQCAETSETTCPSCKSILCALHTYIHTFFLPIGFCQTHIVAAQYQREAAADHVQRSHGHHAQERRREEGRFPPSYIHTYITVLQFVQGSYIRNTYIRSNVCVICRLRP